MRRRRRSCWCPDRRRRRPVSTAPQPPSARGFLERGGAHGDDLLGVLRLDRRDGVAGVDRPRERVRALDRKDVADLHHVEQCGDARRDILAGRRGRRDERVVARPSASRRSARPLRRAGARAPARSRHRPWRRRRSCRACGDAVDIVADDQRMHFAELRGGGHRRQRRVLDGLPSCSTRTRTLISQSPAP